MSQLLPDGITHLGDAPFTLHNAILQALRILQYEEFPIEERPPRRIWLDNDKLNEHFERVSEERKAKYSGDVTPKEDDEDADVNGVELISRG